jgi:hypothetical protein
MDHGPIALRRSFLESVLGIAPARSMHAVLRGMQFPNQKPASLAALRAIRHGRRSNAKPAMPGTKWEARRAAFGRTGGLELRSAAGPACRVLRNA